MTLHIYEVCKINIYYFIIRKKGNFKSQFHLHLKNWIVGNSRGIHITAIDKLNEKSTIFCMSASNCLG